MHKEKIESPILSFKFFYKRPNKEYFHKFIDFDGTSKTIEYDDVYILNEVAKQCNTTPEIVKECVDTFYVLTKKQLMGSKQNVAYMYNPYIYMVYNNNDVLNIEKSIRLIFYREHLNKMIRTIKKLFKRIATIPSLKNYVNDNKKEIVEYTHKKLAKVIPNNTFSLINSINISTSPLLIDSMLLSKYISLYIEEYLIFAKYLDKGITNEDINNENINTKENDEYYKNLLDIDL